MTTKNNVHVFSRREENERILPIDDPHGKPSSSFMLDDSNSVLNMFGLSLLKRRIFVNDT